MTSRVQTDVIMILLYEALPPVRLESIRKRVVIALARNEGIRLEKLESIENVGRKPFFNSVTSLSENGIARLRITSGVSCWLSTDQAHAHPT